MKNFNIANFRDKYKLHKISDLPKPEVLNYVKSFERYNLKKPLSDLRK